MITLRDCLTLLRVQQLSLVEACKLIAPAYCVRCRCPKLAYIQSFRPTTNHKISAVPCVKLVNGASRRVLGSISCAECAGSHGLHFFVPRIRHRP